MKWEDDYEWWIRLFEGVTITPDETKENQNKPWTEWLGWLPRFERDIFQI
jgi:hypothetical protein